MSAEETMNDAAGLRARQPRATGERLPINARLESSGDTWTIHIPLRREEVTAEKQVLVTGEVAVGKLQREEIETVTGTVLREEVYVETAGSAGERLKGNLG
jgi:uncharacterized protein (TIGR02271 family)